MSVPAMKVGGRRGARCIAPLILNLGDRSEWSRPDRFVPVKKKKNRIRG